METRKEEAADDAFMLGLKEMKSLQLDAVPARSGSNCSTNSYGGN